jgi:enoyl-CoA hydratase/carnithine racemase
MSTEPTYESITISTDGPITTIVLDRPEKRNALSLPTMLEIIDALHNVAESDADAVIVAANGPVFSAGHNFADMAGADLDATRHLFDVCTQMMNLVQEIPQVVVAKVHALATAAGCQLVASCDLAVAAESAAFALPGGKGGLFCHTPLVAVSRNIGRKRALEMAFTGDPIDARTAAEWGLVNRVVPDVELDDAVLDLVTRAIRGSAMSKALGKQAFYAQIGLEQTDAYGYAAEVMARAAVSPDAQEGIRAFLDKRAAVFTERPNG